MVPFFMLVSISYKMLDSIYWILLLIPLEQLLFSLRTFSVQYLICVKFSIHFNSLQVY